MKSNFMMSSTLVVLILLSGLNFAEEKPTSRFDFSSIPKATAVIQNLATPVSLNYYIRTLEDHDRSFTSKAIATGQYDLLFKDNKEDLFVPENNQNRYWFQFSLTAGEQLNDKNAVLYFNTHPTGFNYLKLFIYSAQQPTKVIEVGKSVPYYSRDIESLKYAFRVPLEHGEITKVIGMIDNPDAIQPFSLPLHLVSEEVFSKESDRTETLLTAFYAMMFALLTYNFCLFIALRESIYGYYLLFLTGAIYTSSALDGNTGRLFFANHPAEDLVALRLNAILTMMAYTAFVYHTLDKIPSLKWYRWVYITMLAVGAIQAFLTLTGIVFNVQIYGIVTMCVNLLVVLFAVKQKLPLAVYLLTAESFVLIGGSIFDLTMNGELLANEFTLFALHIGFLGEALFLSLALAARTRQAQETAIEYLENYKQLYQDSHEGLFQYDLTTKKFTCNPALARLFGHENEEELYRINASGKERKLENDIYDILTKGDGSIMGYEYQIHSDKLKKTIWTSLTIKTTFDETGNAIGIEGSMLDITDRKLREAAQHNAITNLKKADKQKDEFLATISHELLTPMNGIVGYLELLQHQEHINEVQELLQTASRSTSEMSELIDKILNFTQGKEEKPKESNVNLDSTIPHKEQTSTLKLEDPSQDDSASFHPGVTTDTAKILIVEDNITNRMVLQGILKRLGYQTLTAENGVEAIEVLNTEPVHFIFMDCQMPVMDGFETTKKIRARKDSIRGIPIVAVTANVMKADQERCLETGMDDYIKKPIKKDIIKAVLDKWL